MDCAPKTVSVGGAASKHQGEDWRSGVQHAERQPLLQQPRIRLLITRAWSMPVVSARHVKPGGSSSLTQSLRHVRVSLLYSRRRLQGYVSADERRSVEAYTIGTAYAFASACAGTSAILLRWIPEKSTRCNGCSLVRQPSPVTHAPDRRAHAWQSYHV